MKTNRKTQAFEVIKNRILTFQLLPGVKISEEDFASELGISRTPVREALNRLSEVGLVESILNRGFSVKKFRKKEVEDLYILRECLERLTVKLAIDNWDDEKEQELQSLLDEYPKIMKAGNLAEFSRVDDSFHALIAQYSSNHALCESLERLRDKIIVIRRYDHLRSTSFDETYKEHLKIFDFIVKGETKKAEKNMSMHILGSMKKVIELLNQ
jgi:DNA-binding GntR family transcriptional regulator